MRLLIESTPQIVTLDGVQCRHWHGTTESGAGVDVYVHRIGTADPIAQAEIEHDLRKVQAPALTSPAVVETPPVCWEGFRDWFNAMPGSWQAGLWQAIGGGAWMGDLDPRPGSTTRVAVFFVHAMYAKRVVTALTVEE